LDGRDQRWEVWVRDEDQLQQATLELTTFLENPSDPKYDAAVSEATKLLEEEQKAKLKAASNIRRIKPAASAVGLNRGPIPPLTLTLAIIAGVISLASGFTEPAPNNKWGQLIVSELSFVAPTDFMLSKGDPAASLKKGEVWRAITPIFMHGNMLHLAMNLFMLISLGRLVERIVGTPRYAILILLLAIGPNLLQGLAPPWMHGSPHFVGISGVVYGLFGYIWIYSKLHPESGIFIPMPIVLLFVGMIVIGLTMQIPNWKFADLCHLGGLLVGIATAFASEKR
jgi:GlpG protein